MSKQKAIRATAVFFSIILMLSCSPIKGWQELEAGKKYAEGKNYLMAAGEYTKAIKKTPDYWKLYFYRSEAYEKTNRFDLAIDDLSKAIEIVPKIEAWHEKVPNNEWAVIYMRRGKLYHDKNFYQLALNDYTKALELDPHSVGASFYRAITKEKMNLLPEAIEDYSKTINKMSKVVSGVSDSDKIRVYQNRAKLFLRQGKTDLALVDVNSALEIKPDSAELYEKRGVIHAKSENFKKAIHDFNKAIEMEPSYNAYIWRANIRLITSCDLKNILEDYYSVVNLENVDNNILLKVFNDIAWILATASDNTIRDTKKAVKYAKMSIDIKPQWGNLDTLAVAFAGFGQFQEAINVENQAIELCESDNSKILSKLEKHLEIFKSKKSIKENCPGLNQKIESFQTWQP